MRGFPFTSVLVTTMRGFAFTSCSSDNYEEIPCSVPVLVTTPRALLALCRDFSSLPVYKACDWCFAGSPVYNLYALCNHSGSVHYGHYTAYCKDPSGWHAYNDSR